MQEGLAIKVLATVFGCIVPVILFSIVSVTNDLSVNLKLHC